MFEINGKPAAEVSDEELRTILDRNGLAAVEYFDNGKLVRIPIAEASRVLLLMAIGQFPQAIEHHP